MICQNCQATVDNDLVFCTNCGSRLSAAPPDPAQQRTVSMSEPTITNASASAHKAPAKPNSSLKWVALIVALIALPVSLGIAYLLLRDSDSAPVNAAQNINKPTPANRRTGVNNAAGNKSAPPPAANTNAVNANANANITNANTNEVDDPSRDSVEIFNDRREIAAGEHVAHPFKVTTGSAKINGDLQTLRGEPVQGYVFFQNNYDEHFPDATYKVFSFEGKNPSIEQTLVKGDYVLIFLNESKKSTTIEGQFYVTPDSKTE